MSMKYIFSIIIFLLINSIIHSQDLYHRVRIDLFNKEIEELAKLGIEVDHGHIAIGRYLESDFSDAEIKQIQKAGFEIEVLINDMGTYYREQMAAGLDRMMMGCEDEDVFSNIATPENFTLGSMGGFYTYEELLSILDDMHNKFPELISEKEAIGEFQTYEGREIFALEISDNPGIDEGEPSSLYTAIHHAREPNSLTQTIYFMWYLLENYETDPLIKEIIDNTSLHFIPCVNPDGYIFNEQNEPNGGGFWRKNRRDNGDGTFGVDLNRNYGFQWGINDVGSSPDPNSETYRGEAPFSEAETQAVKFYCEQHSFKMAMNYHTFGNALIYPWSFNDSPTPENDFFQAMAEDMTKFNSYIYGTTIETIGYTVNGDSDDWMYGEEGTKDKIYPFTPEVGVEGFWPPIDRIVYNCQANIHTNIVTAAILLSYPIIKSSSIQITDEYEAEIDFNIQQIGFEALPFETELTVLSNNGILDNTSFSYDLNQLDEKAEKIVLQLDNSISFGDEIMVLIESTEGLNIISDTLRIDYNFGGLETFLVYDEIGSGDFWIADGEQWFYGNDKFVSEDFSFTDSPNENYNSGENKSIKSKTVSLPEDEVILLNFDLYVNIEDNYDFAVLYIEKVGSPRVPLCGKYSDSPQNDQPFDEPVYDGAFDWVNEEIDISAWAGMDVQFTLRLGSDNFLEREGIYIDNWSISTFKEIVSINELEINSFELYPNPANDFIKIGLPFESIHRVTIYTELGSKVIESGEGIDLIDISSCVNGDYYIIVQNKKGEYFKSKFVVVK